MNLDPEREIAELRERTARLEVQFSGMNKRLDELSSYSRQLFDYLSRSGPKLGPKPDDSWYVLPVLFGLLGGLIMLLALYDRDKDMAVKGLILGVITTVVVYAILSFVWLRGV